MELESFLLGLLTALIISEREQEMINQQNNALFCFWLWIISFIVLFVFGFYLLNKREKKKEKDESD